jgi:hypothetical protein
MTMVKQRRSFFVDDILHMVMPINKTTNSSNEINDRKRKRSMTPDHNRKEEKSIEEEISNKKFRFYHNGEKNDDDDDDEEENDNDKFKHSQIVDVLGDGGTGEESSISDDSNSVDNNSGKLGYMKSI